MSKKDKAEKMKYIAGIDPGEEVEPSFTYQGFQIWSKVLIVGVYLLLLGVNFHVLEPGTLFAHARTALITMITGRSYMYVEEFVDIGVETGMIAEPVNGSERGEN